LTVELAATMIKCERLELIPATASTTRAALEDNREQLSALLRAHVPASWPPDLLDPPALEWVLRSLADPGHDPTWGLFWVVLRDGPAGPTLIGTAGIKGKPKDGGVELGYGIVAEHQRRGYATEATRALIEHSFASPHVQRVIAETLPGLVSSIGVMEKCGFRFIGDGSEPGVIRYEILRTPRPEP
jgi:RimJ/RimL family protein N-acetyltransferase